MTRARRIAIVHHRRSFFALDLRRAIGQDLDPIWVLADDSGSDRALVRLLTRSGPVVEAEGLPVDEIATRLAEHRPDGIVTFVDDTLRLTAALAARLGLPYHTEAQAATIVDKGLQRAAFAAAGLPGPEFWTLPSGLDAAQLRERARGITYPAVLKPAEGSGSRGLRWLTDAEDLIAAYHPDGGAVVEEYLGDTPARDTRFASYLSLESVVSGGEVSHVAFCGRFPLAHPFRETGNFIPAAVPDGMQAELEELATGAIRSLSIHNAICHTEIKLTARGPRLIEVNGRLGGRPPFVLQSVSEVNLFRVACDLALGEAVTLPGLAPTREIGFWWMAQPPQEAGAVRAVRGLDAVAAATEVDSVSLDRRPGEPVDWQEGTAGVVVTVHGRAPDLDALARTIEMIESTLVIDYTATGEPTSAAGGAFAARLP